MMSKELIAEFTAPKLCKNWLDQTSQPTETTSLMATSYPTSRETETDGASKPEDITQRTQDGLVKANHLSKKCSKTTLKTSRF